MNWLRDKIEKEIKALSENRNVTESPNGQAMTAYAVASLKEIISLIDQANCSNCKYNIDCDKKETWIETDDNMVRTADITYCSNFETKDL